MPPFLRSYWTVSIYVILVHRGTLYKPGKTTGGSGDFITSALTGNSACRESTVRDWTLCSSSSIKEEEPTECAPMRTQWISEEAARAVRHTPSGAQTKKMTRYKEGLFPLKTGTSLSTSVNAAPCPAPRTAWTSDRCVYAHVSPEYLLSNGG